MYRLLAAVAAAAEAEVIAAAKAVAVQPACQNIKLHSLNITHSRKIQH